MVYIGFGRVKNYQGELDGFEGSQMIKKTFMS